MASPNNDLIEIYPGLYEISSPGDASPDIPGHNLWAYFLSRKDTEPHHASSPDITFEYSWENMTGWYIFIGAQISKTDAPRFIKNAYEQLPPLPASTQSAHTIVWLESLSIPDNITHISTQTISYFHTIKNQVDIEWSGLKLELQPSIKATLTSVNDCPVIRFTTDSSNLNLVNLYYYGVKQTLGYRSDGWQIDVYFSGTGTGSFNFGVGLDPNQLGASLGCNFTYTSGHSTSTQFQYPLFALGEPKANYFVAFDIWLNPVLVTCPTKTRFQIDSTDRIGKTGWKNHANDLVSHYFFTNDGTPIQLVPIDPYQSASPATNNEIGAGFAFSFRPSHFSPSASPQLAELYLSPIGWFRLEKNTSPDSNSQLDVMGGLFTREFLRLQGNDEVLFVNNLPAYSESFSLLDSPTDATPVSTKILSSTYTTSWAQLESKNETGQYFGEPSSASFFGEVHSEDFPIAIDVLLAGFTLSEAFPLVPYGGVFSNTNLNRHLSSDDFNRFEAAIIGAVRHSVLTQHSEGPVFYPQNANSPSGTLLSATNPQGLLIDLNDNGTWNSLTLAIEAEHLEASPPIPATRLEFLSTGSPACFPKDLSLILTQNQLFYVVTIPNADWDFASKTYLGGFEFDLSLDAEGNKPLNEQTIMVFKFNTTTTLKELAAKPGMWTKAETYTTDPAATSNALINYIDFAHKEASAPGDPFENFNQIVNDKEWTGVLFFNAAINGNGMPTDLQMLLGGINGGLRAHHVGIQGNLMDRYGTPDKLEITKSSLFGVIFYDEENHLPSPAVADYPVDYEVEKLIVVFSNSAIAQFNTTVNLTLNSLFGRAVKKRNSSPSNPTINPNTLSIKGQYQSSSDGVGRVTFLSTESFVYDFVPASNGSTQVLDRITFDQATLVPISSEPGKNSGTTDIQARFSLKGALWFNSDPFPHSEGLDLFSYGSTGINASGLDISNLGTDIWFTLGTDGVSEPGSKTIALDISALNASPSNHAIRPNSLLFSIPLKFSRFVTAIPKPTKATNQDSKPKYKPINASNTGSTSVNILQLEGPSTGSSGSPSVSGMSGSYTTGSALYALEYNMLLGSLGALGASAKLEAKVLLAWGPSATTPDNDAAAMFVQLPQLSAGAGGFELEGILKTTFGDANLLKVDLDNGQQTVYALLFNNIQLSVFGYRFPPGVLIDFMVFAGATTPGKIEPTYANNLAWFLSAQQEKASP